MNELDRKLDEILKREQLYVQQYTLASIYVAKNNGQWVIRNPNRAKALEDVKQAFIDDGWQKLSGLDRLCLADRDNRIENNIKVTTGQEWYDKLLLNIDINRYHTSDPEYVVQHEIILAAKKAAGIE
jgi:hypothetical protein